LFQGILELAENAEVYCWAVGLVVENGVNEGLDGQVESTG
jgi:hypothetical protein